MFKLLICAHLRNLRDIHSKQVLLQITRIFADKKSAGNSKKGPTPKSFGVEPVSWVLFKLEYNFPNAQVENT